MAKFVPTELTSLGNETTFLSALNQNFIDLATALENTLSRDGTSPNAMEAILDMASWSFYNNGGVVVLTDLPTSDPAETGQLWNDGGTVKVSAGA